MNAVKIDKQAIFPQSFGVQTAGKQLCWKMLFAVLSLLGESQNTKVEILSEIAFVSPYHQKHFVESLILQNVFETFAQYIFIF